MNKKDKTYLIIAIGIAALSTVIGMVFNLPIFMVIAFTSLGTFNAYNHLKIRKNYDSRLIKYIKMEAYTLGLAHLALGLSFALDNYYINNGGKTTEIKVFLTLLPIIPFVMHIFIFLARRRANKKIMLNN